MTALGKRTLPLWAAALDLPADFFAPYFENNYTYVRLAHYPPQPALAGRPVPRDLPRPRQPAESSTGT